MKRARVGLDNDDNNESHAKQRLRRGSAGSAMDDGPASLNDRELSVASKGSRGDAEDGEGNIVGSENGGTGTMKATTLATLSAKSQSTPFFPDDDDHEDDDNHDEDAESGATYFGPNIQDLMRRYSEPDTKTGPWGFVVYRTTYDNDTEWATFRQRFDEIIAADHESILSERGDPDSLTFKWVEDKTLLNNATSQQIRLIFNPLYTPDCADDADEDPDDRDPSPCRENGLALEACLMIDTFSMRSITNHTPDGDPGYVIVVDADSEISEQYRYQVPEHYCSEIPGQYQIREIPNSEVELVRAEYDGTMKVHIEFLMTEFYLRSIKDDLLIMGEIHGKPGRVWKWVGDEDDEEAGRRLMERVEREALIEDEGGGGDEESIVKSEREVSSD